MSSMAARGFSESFPGPSTTALIIARRSCLTPLCRSRRTASVVGAGATYLTGATLDSERGKGVFGNGGIPRGLHGVRRSCRASGRVARRAPSRQRRDVAQHQHQRQLQLVGLVVVVVDLMVM